MACGKGAASVGNGGDHGRSVAACRDLNIFAPILFGNAEWCAYSAAGSNSPSQLRWEY
jgi:hypothetical protein